MALHALEFSSLDIPIHTVRTVACAVRNGSGIVPVDLLAEVGVQILMTRPMMAAVWKLSKALGDRNF
jgi:hypothetical protein